MKKIALIIVITSLMTSAFAQKATVVSAYNFHNSGRLDKAKEAIDKAITNEKTMLDAKTWFYRGNIYIDIQRSPIEEYRALDPDAIDKAYAAYLRAIELDDKNRYTDDIRSFMPIVGEAFFNKGAELFNDGLLALEEGEKDAATGRFDAAANSFEKAFNIYAEAGISDTTSIYFVSLAAELGEDWEKARKNLEKLVEMEYNQSGIYSSLANIYYMRYQNNLEKNLKLREEYLSLQKVDKAKEYLITYEVECVPGGFSVTYLNNTGATEQLEENDNYWKKSFTVDIDQNNIVLLTAQANNAGAKILGNVYVDNILVNTASSLGDYVVVSIDANIETSSKLPDQNLVKSLEIYTLGRNRFPEDFNLLLNETNLFLSEDMTEEALDNLTKAAEIDTLNASIFFAIGAKYNELADDTTRSEETRKDYFDKSVVAYNKSIEIDPDYFDPNYNMGALYVNKAAAIITVANELPLNEVKQYDAMKTESDNYLHLSLPYLERAHEIDPEDMATLVSLKEIYTRLNMIVKLKEVDQKIHEHDE